MVARPNRGGPVKRELQLFSENGHVLMLPGVYASPDAPKIIDLPPPKAVNVAVAAPSSAALEALRRILTGKRRRKDLE